MPSTREWRARDYLAADREVIERAAQWLRTDPGRHEHAGLQHDDQAHGRADLLEVLAAGVAELNRAVRWQTVQSCRVLLGESMESPGIRRTRRR